MSILDAIKSAIFSTAPPPPPVAPPSDTGVGTPAGPIPAADLLAALAAKAPEKLDWHNSIVDLLKLTGQDSSLEARKKLAEEMGYTGDESDTEAMNVWLHKEVMRHLGQHGRVT